MKYMNIFIFISLKTSGSIFSPKRVCYAFLKNLNEPLGVHILILPMKGRFQVGFEAAE